MKQKVQVWIHWSTEAEGRKILLLQTTTERGSFWQPVTGSVESGESRVQAARREAVEETGLRLSGEVMELGFDFRYRNDRGSFEETCFEIEFVGGNPEVILDPKEHQSYEWVSLEEVEKRLRFESNQKAFRQLKKHLKKHLS